jgi:hypothetical protein
MTKTEQTLVEIFNSIEDEGIKNAIINNLKHVAHLSTVATNHYAIAIALDTKSLSEFVGHKNTPYLAKFMKFLVKNDSVAIKDQVINIIEKI